MQSLWSHPALASVHCLLLEALSDLEVDLRGAHRGGCLDVELIPILADLHVRLRCSRHCHLPQHGVHTCTRKHGLGSQVLTPGPPDLFGIAQIL